MWFLKNKKNVAVYSMLFFCMLILARANVMHIIYPFAFSFLFTLVYLEKNVFLLSLFYLISGLVYHPTISCVTQAICVVSFAVLLFLFFKLVKKKIPMWTVFIFCALSQAGFLYFNIYSMHQVVVSIVSIVVGLCFMYICIVSFDAIFYRGLQSRFTLDESICFGVFLIAFFSGIIGIYAWQVNLSFAIVLFAFLII